MSRLGWFVHPYDCRNLHLWSSGGKVLSFRRLRFTSPETDSNNRTPTIWVDVHPGRLTAWTWKWCFGRWFSFAIGWFLGSMLIFRGVSPIENGDFPSHGSFFFGGEGVLFLYPAQAGAQVALLTGSSPPRACEIEYRERISWHFMREKWRWHTLVVEEKHFIHSCGKYVPTF